MIRLRLAHLPTLLLSGLLIILLLAEWLYIYPKNLQQARNLAELNMRSSLVADIDFVQSRVNTQNWAEIREFFSARSAIPGLEEITLVDPNGLIMASTAIETEGQHGPDSRYQDWLNASTPRQPAFTLAANKLSAMVHIRFAPGIGQGKLGAVYTRTDLAPLLAVTTTSTLDSMILLALAMFIGGITMQWITDRLLGRRLQQLAGDAQLMTDGQRHGLFTDHRDDEIGAVSSLLRKALANIDEQSQLAERLAVTIESTGAGIFEVNTNNWTFTGNDQFFAMLGEKNPGRPLPVKLIRRHLPAKDRRRLILWTDTLLILKTAEAQDYQFNQANGEALRIRLTLKATAFDAQGKTCQLTGLAVDNTMQRRQKITIQENSARLNIAFDSLTVGIVVADETGTITMVNSCACTMFGYTHETLMGKNVELLTPPEHTAHHAQYIQNYLQTGIRKLGTPRNLQGRRSNGQLFPIQLTIGEYKQRDESGWVSSITDLSELRNLEGQLMQSQKMDAMGQLAGGIAHDFNNLLQVIIGHTGLALESDQEQLNNHLQMIDQASKRAAQLTGQLLAFSHKREMTTNYVDLFDVCNDIIMLLRRLLGDTIQLELVTQGRGAMVNADRNMLDQVLMNLTLNAKDAMTSGGTISIELEAASQAVATGPAFHCLKVRDTGTGISAAARQQIFEPFFSTKERGKGTGLGLTIVDSIVHQHHGHLKVNSHLGQGTCISVFIPAVAVPSIAPASTTPAANLQNHEQVLVIDDDRAVSDLVMLLLRGAGYRVITAASGAEAIRIFQDTDGIDLVITDLMMPGMNGYETASALRKINPQIPVIFSSGDSEQTPRLDPDLDKGTLLLLKPYNRADLLRTVDLVLAATRAASTSGATATDII